MSTQHIQVQMGRRAYLPRPFKVTVWSRLSPYFKELNTRQVSDDRQFREWFYDWQELSLVLSNMIAQRFQDSYLGESPAAIDHYKYAVQVLFPHIYGQHIQLQQRFTNFSFDKSNLPEINHPIIPAVIPILADQYDLMIDILHPSQEIEDQWEALRAYLVLDDQYRQIHPNANELGNQTDSTDHLEPIQTTLEVDFPAFLNQISQSFESLALQKERLQIFMDLSTTPMHLQQVASATTLGVAVAPIFKHAAQLSAQAPRLAIPASVQFAKAYLLGLGMLHLLLPKWMQDQGLENPEETFNQIGRHTAQMLQLLVTLRQQMEAETIESLSDLNQALTDSLKDNADLLAGISLPKSLLMALPALHEQMMSFCARYKRNSGEGIMKLLELVNQSGIYQLEQIEDWFNRD